MNYSLNEIIHMMRVYHSFESAAKDFLYISISSLKDKSYQVKSAQAAIAAIEQYRQLPSDIQAELEKDKSSYASKINDIEKACRLAIERNK